MQYRPILFTCIIILIMNTFLHAQQKDTIVVKNDSIQLKQKSAPAPDAAKKSPAKDTVKVVKHIPRKASIRSALIPGCSMSYRAAVRSDTCRAEANDEIVSGYEYSKDHYVEVEPEGASERDEK